MLAIQLSDDQFKYLLQDTEFLKNLRVDILKSISEDYRLKQDYIGCTRNEVSRILETIKGIKSDLAEELKEELRKDIQNHVYKCLESYISSSFGKVIARQVREAQNG